jgi:hypothetical protein
MGWDELGREKASLCGDFLRLQREGKGRGGFTFQRPRVNKRIQAREAGPTERGRFNYLHSVALRITKIPY